MRKIFGEFTRAPEPSMSSRAYLLKPQWLTKVIISADGVPIATHFVIMTAEIEIAITALNMLTDLLLFALALRLYLNLDRRRRARSLALPIALVGLTLSVAAGRLALFVIHYYIMRDLEFIVERSATALKVLMELDSFLALFVVCMPGLRVWVRNKGHTETEGSTSNRC